MNTQIIQIPGDELVPNEALAQEWDCTERTLNRYDKRGLPFVMVGGRKFRPLNAARDWLAGNIKRLNPKRGAAKNATAA